MLSPSNIKSILGSGVNPVAYPEPKVYHIPAWARMSDSARMTFLRKIVLEYGRDPRFAERGQDICVKAGAEARNGPKQAAALLKFVQGLYYRNEPGERIQTPDYTLKIGGSDCDDLAILLATFFESFRLPWRFVLSGKDKRSGQIVRWVEGTPEVRGVDWSHIYLVVGDKPFNPAKWFFCEPTIKNAPFGWDVVSGPRLPGMAASSAPLPELAGFFGAAPASTAAASGGGVVSAATSSEFSWAKIAIAVAAGVTTSVLSQLVLDKIRRS